MERLSRFLAQSERMNAHQLFANEVFWRSVQTLAAMTSPEDWRDLIPADALADIRFVLVSDPAEWLVWRD